MDCRRSGTKPAWQSPRTVGQRSSSWRPCGTQSRPTSCGKAVERCQGGCWLADGQGPANILQELVKEQAQRPTDRGRRESGRVPSYVSSTTQCAETGCSGAGRASSANVLCAPEARADSPRVSPTTCAGAKLENQDDSDKWLVATTATVAGPPSGSATRLHQP